MLDDLLLFDSQIPYFSKLFFQYLRMILVEVFFGWKRVGFDLGNELSISDLLLCLAIKGLFYMIVLAGGEVCERRKALPPAPGLWGPCPQPRVSLRVRMAAQSPLPRGFIHQHRLAARPVLQPTSWQLKN